MKECPFCKIVEERLESTRLQAAAVGANLNVAGVIIDAKDPQAPVHKLVILRTHQPDYPFGLASRVDDLFRMALRYASGTGLGSPGFRLVVNFGPNSGSTIDHPHIHILAGRPLGDICERKTAP